MAALQFGQELHGLAELDAYSITDRRNLSVDVA